MNRHAHSILLKALALTVFSVMITLDLPSAFGFAFIMPIPNPSYGATEVGIKTPFILIFNVPMKPAGSLTWSANVDSTKITYSWSADATQLTCVYAPGWPANSTIQWSADAAQFTGADGAKMLFPLTGSFKTAASSGSSSCEAESSDPNQGSYTVAKVLQYMQIDASRTVLSTGNPAAFSAILRASPLNKVSSVMLKLPNGTRQELYGYLYQTFSFRDSTAYASQTELDAAYPDGTYELQWQLDTGVYGSSVLPLPGDSYPPTPMVLNYNLMQNLDPTQDFVLQFTPFTGAASTDTVNFDISDSSGIIFKTPDLCVPRTLSPTASSLTIPKGTLRTNKIYQVTLSFIRLTRQDNTSMAHATGTAFLSKTLQFNLQTLSGVVPAAPRLTRLKRLAPGEFQIELTGQANVPYQILYSSDLRSWDPLVTSNSASGVFQFTDSPSINTGQRYYRARLAVQ